MAERLARKHVIPESSIVHPKVKIMNSDGTVDEFMTAKLREPHYVPYCLKTVDCGRVRRREWGFECPTCCNKMNYDLTHFDGNQNVVYDGPAPVPSREVWNAQVEARKRAREDRRLAK